MGEKAEADEGGGEQREDDRPGVEREFGSGLRDGTEFWIRHVNLLWLRDGIPLTTGRCGTEKVRGAAASKRRESGRFALRFNLGGVQEL